MELMNEVTQEKMCTVITRFYSSDDKEISISPNEKFISQVYVPWSKDYLTVTEEYKDYSKIKDGECNFISKIRALTKEHKQLPFSQKYPVLAFEIENAAKEGKNYYFIPLLCLSSSEKNDLKIEGFKVEQWNTLEYKISW